MASFVFDRTLADVQALNAKGTYNAADLNRVQNAVDEIAALLSSAGIGVNLTPWTKATWSFEDIPTLTDMSVYLGNISKIRASIPNTAPALPSSMNYLTYEGANNIERALFEVQTLLRNLLLIYPKSGLFMSANVLYTPEYSAPFDFAALNFADVIFG